MTIATVLGLFIIPVCYVFVQQLVERGGKKPIPPVPPPANPPAPVPTGEGGAH
jgi:hypothetical protein